MKRDMVGGGHSLTISASSLLRLGREDDLDEKGQSLNELMRDKAVCRTALATPGLLNIS